MTTTVLSKRRSLVVYDGENGQPGYIGMWVDNVQVAAGVRVDDSRWHLWSSGLTLDEAAPAVLRDERSVRGWLALLADIAEGGPRAVESRRR